MMRFNILVVLADAGYVSFQTEIQTGTLFAKSVDAAVKGAMRYGKRAPAIRVFVSLAGDDPAWSYSEEFIYRRGEWQPRHNVGETS